MSRRVISLVGLLALILGSFLPGLTPAGAQDGIEPHVLRHNWVDPPPDTLDPHHSDGGQGDISFGVDYEGLTRLDAEFNPIPGAAESWEFSPDGMTLTFHLRDGNVFSDGVPITAEHFVYSARRLCSPELDSRSASLLFDVVGCEGLFTSRDNVAGTPVVAEAAAATEAFDFGVRALDARTVEYQFEKPAPYFPVLAARWGAIPLREDLIEAGDPEWWANPATRIGNGLFKVTEYRTEEPDQILIFERNERYWDGPTKLERLEFLFLDVGEGIEAYRNGEVDITWPGDTSLPEVEADPVLSREIVTIPAGGMFYYLFNITREPFSDPKVREAFAYGFDREAFCLEIAFGACTPSLSWIPPGVRGHIASSAYAFDPAKARQALAESTYGNPENLPEIDWYVGPGEASAQDAAWLAAMYRESLGVELNIVTLPWEEIDALYEDVATTPQFHTSIWYAGPEIGGWFSKWRCNFPSNEGYCNPRYDELVDRAGAELDPAKRLELYEAAQRVLLADPPAIFVSPETFIWLIKPYVVGYSRTIPSEFFPGFTNLLTVDVVPSE